LYRCREAPGYSLTRSIRCRRRQHEAKMIRPSIARFVEMVGSRRESYAAAARHGDGADRWRADAQLRQFCAALLYRPIAMEERKERRRRREEGKRSSCPATLHIARQSSIFATPSPRSCRMSQPSALRRRAAGAMSPAFFAVKVRGVTACCARQREFAARQRAPCRQCCAAVIRVAV